MWKMLISDTNGRFKLLLLFNPQSKTRILLIYFHKGRRKRQDVTSLLFYFIIISFQRYSIYKT